MAKEHGMMEHKGKTIPKEVKSLADRIRKEQPDKDDEYAYRTAWDIYRSYTAEGKQYPHKSPESGLAREGGGTGPLSKQGSLEWAEKDFWQGFFKQAALKQPGFLSKMQFEQMPLEVPKMVRPKALKVIKPAKEPLNYAAMNEVPKKPQGSTIRYGSKGAMTYTPPPQAT